MKKNIFSLAVILTSTVVFAQHQKEELTPLNKLEQQTQALEYAVSNLQKLKVSGYIQAQYQWGEEAASLKVGSRNENPKEPFNRMGVRRGRVKFAYEEGLTSSVFQIDMTEKGIGFKDVYLQIKDPWVGTISLKRESSIVHLDTKSAIHLLVASPPNVQLYIKLCFPMSVTWVLRSHFNHRKYHLGIS